MGKRITEKEFIKESKKKFGNKFSYSNTVYIDKATKVTITCRKHGDFEVWPNNHLKGNGGCKKCMKEHMRQLFSSNIEEFIKKSKERFGDKFKYDKTVYNGYNTELTITCRKHGDFTVTPSNHLREGRNGEYNGGCKECARERAHEEQASNIEEFIKKSKERFGDKFEYDKTVYINDRTELTITCRKHGDFTITPGNHLKKNSNGGCKECKKERIHEVRSLTTEEFIERSKERFGDKFGYDRTIYNGFDTELTITCRKPGHGDFTVIPNNHLYGCGGCPKCNSSKLEDDIRRLLTKNKIKFEEQKSFTWLVGPNGGFQTLDFYLSDLGIGIECQGEQHFHAVKYFGGEEKLKYTQECDRNKLKLCEEHGIKLIYYSNLSAPDKPFDYPYPVYEDGAKLIEKLMSMLDNDTDAEDTAQN